MRYAKYENVNLMGFLTPNSNVTIKVVALSNDSETLLELNDNVCIESEHIPGVYRWSTVDLTNAIIGYTELIYIMENTDNEEDVYSSKIALSGSYDNLSEIDGITEIINNIQQVSYDQEFATIIEALGNLDIDIPDDLGTMIDDLKTSIDDSVNASSQMVSDVNRILDYNEGNWEIDNHQMIFHRKDGSELARFNLLDKNNNPSSMHVFKRELVQ